MQELLLVTVMVITALCDSFRDQMRSGPYRRPESHLIWPLIDIWHLTKNIGLNAPWGYLLACWFFPGLSPQYWISWLIGAVTAYLAWKVVPRPSWWR